MQTILLLGAGFSHNWGGWLATELFENLLATAEVRGDSGIRQLLWKHQREEGFEGALAELQLAAERDPRSPPQDQLVRLQAAILQSFRTMQTAMDQVPWEFSQDRALHVTEFLVKFDRIFTLNQDTLLERHYVQNIALANNRRSFNSPAFPGMRCQPAGGQPSGANSWADSPWVPANDFSVPDGGQPIYKLHGSMNWRAAQGDPMLIMGGGKSRQIAANRVLAAYAEEFQRSACSGARLMVIGYGFRDEHINQCLFHGAERGLEMFVVDPRGSALADSLNSTRTRGQIIDPSKLEALFERTLIGASRRPLAATFRGDAVEMRKLEEFFRG